MQLEKVANAWRIQKHQQLIVTVDHNCTGLFPKALGSFWNASWVPRGALGCPEGPWAPYLALFGRCCPVLSAGCPAFSPQNQKLEDKDQPGASLHVNPRPF